MTEPPPEWPTGALARGAALLAALAALLALGLADLLAPPAVLLACLLASAAAALPRWVRDPALAARLRPPAAIGCVLAVLGVAFASGGPAPMVPQLGTMPSGLLAAFAAGALCGVVLEGHARRGLLSGLVLSAAVLGLTAALAVDGQKLLPAFVIGWPAVLLALARVAAVPGDTHVPVLERTGDGTRAAGRWVLVPAVASLAVGVVVVSLLRLGGGWSGSGGPGTGGLGGPGLGGAAGRAAGQYLGTSMDLRSRGSLDDSPILAVPEDSPTLWRGGVLDRYDNGSWSTVSGRGTEAPRLAQTGTSVDVTPSPEAPAAPDGPPRTDTVRPIARWAMVVVAPGLVRRVQSPSLAGGVNAVLGAGERLYLVGDGRAETYTVTSAMQPLIVGAPADVPAGPADGDPGERWTQLPPTVPDRVLQLGRRLAAVAGNRRDAVLAVENEIRARVRYTLDSPVPSAGTDPVDDVLFTSHAGFCEQFASAAVVMLRAAGIPARIATGFAGGRPDGDERVMREADGHAWAEVWFPGVGWVSSDPTAGAQAATTWWQRAVDRLQDAASGAGWWLAAPLLGGALLAAGVWWRRRRHAPAAAAAEVERRLPAELEDAFARLESALAAAGAPRAPGESLAVLARRLAGAPGAEGDVEAAFEVLQRALYGPAAPPDAECSAAAAVLRRLADAVGDPVPA